MCFHNYREKRILEVRLHKEMKRLLGRNLTKRDITHHEVWLVEDELKGTPLGVVLFEWCASPLIVSGASYLDKEKDHEYTVAHVYCYGPEPVEICLNQVISAEEFLELYNDGEGDSYWTDWY